MNVAPTSSAISRKMAAGVESHAHHLLVVQLAAKCLPVLRGEVADVLGVQPLEFRRFDAMGEDGPEGDKVGVDAAVGLDVGMLGAEEGLRELDGAGLDGVDVVTARVEAVAGLTLGVLIAEPVAHREEDGGRGEVLAGDELEVRTLVGELLADAVGDFGESGADDVEGSAEGDGLG
jgi:hypothetical protein